MSRVLPVVSLCVALLAFAFAVVPRDPVVISSSEPEARRGMDVDAELLRRRVEVLEDDNRTLWDRVVVLERRNNGVVNDAGVLTPSIVSDVAQLRQEVRGLISGEVLSNEASRAALKEVIRETEADSQRERIAQAQQRREQRAQDQKVKWKEFVGTAKLTWQQEQELTKHLEAEEKARLDFAQKMQSGDGAPMGPEVFRAMGDRRRETDEAMNKLLDETQKEQYQALRREDRGGGGRGDRGGERQQPK